MANGGRGSLDDRPTEVRDPQAIMLPMQTSSPIRRYVIVRHRDHGTTASRWSMERVAPTQRDASAAPVAAPRPRPQGARTE
jgi:hypothetical protein